MKKKYVASLIVMLAIIAISYSLWRFMVRNYPYKILAVKSYISEQPPIIWNGIKVNYGFGMHVVYHDSSITIHQWGKEGQEGVGIFLKDKTMRYWLNEHPDGEELKLISSFDGTYKGDRAYITENIKNDNGRYMKRYYLLDFPIFFGYAGPPERLSAYQAVLDSIDYSKFKQ